MKNENITTYELGDYVLLNFKKDGSYDKALEWGKENGYFPVGQDELLEISEKNKNLNKKVGMDYMHLVSTKYFTFDGGRYACYVWWRDSKRGARLDEVEVFGHSDGWFAFRMNSELGKSVPSDTYALCPHENKHTEICRTPVYHTYGTNFSPPIIKTYCSDCGEFIKSVIIKES